MTDAQVIEVRRLIDGLRWDRRRAPYRGRREYATRADDVAAQIDQLIKRKAAAQAVPLARRAVERVTSALLHMDDSSGIVGDRLRELMLLYAKACTAAPPDAKRLAAWLVKMRLDGPGWPETRLAEFKDALGERGLAELARLAADRRATDDPNSWAVIVGVRDLREQLAAVSGDVDAHVAVLAEDLRGTYRYTKIVAALRAAGRDGDAERWAREGLARDTSRPWAGDGETPLRRPPTVGARRGRSRAAPVPLPDTDTAEHIPTRRGAAVRGLVLTSQLLSGVVPLQ